MLCYILTIFNIFNMNIVKKSIHLLEILIIYSPKHNSFLLNLQYYS